MALVLLAFMLAMASVAYMAHTLNAASVNQQRGQRSAAALAQAKAALIGYAVAYDDTHPGEVYGHLPCPDTSAGDINGEGSQSPCGSQDISVLGRLPWKTLKVSPLRDGYGECLWYAVSGTYKNNPKTAAGLVDPMTSGLLLVLGNDGTSYLAGSADPAVAVVFAAGPPLQNQDRSTAIGTANCGGNYGAASYLDSASGTSNAAVSASANAVSTLIAAASGPAFNDRLLVIRRSELFANYCRKYANTLLAHVSGANNACDIGGSPSAACAAASGHLQNHCSATCKVAANTLIEVSCLGNLTLQACQDAILVLKACHA